MNIEMQTKILSVGKKILNQKAFKAFKTLI